MSELHGQSTDPNVPGVLGENTHGEGVRGVSHSQHGGVVGVNVSEQSPAQLIGKGPVYNNPNGGAGVWGESDRGEGVRGVSHSKDHGGVVGYNNKGGVAIYGKADGDAATGGYFEGTFEGVHAGSSHKDAAGVAGYNTSTGPGVYGKSTGGAAGYFEGNVIVTGDVTLTGGADCAEEFDISAATDVEPGTVMVLSQEGMVQPSQQAYDKKVAGVISGAGNYKPGLVLDKQQSSEKRMPVALMGKVYCKVDAQYAPIDVGDLLTTSFTPGHAMKADDPSKAFGSVIGKALRSLEAGQGMIPILIALQ